MLRHCTKGLSGPWLLSAPSLADACERLLADIMVLAGDQKVPRYCYVHACLAYMSCMLSPRLWYCHSGLCCSASCSVGETRGSGDCAVLALALLVRQELMGTLPAAWGPLFREGGQKGPGCPLWKLVPCLKCCTGCHCCVSSYIYCPYYQSLSLCLSVLSTWYSLRKEWSPTKCLFDTQHKYT